MTALAMIMAGGGGTRMRASGGAAPKPLMQVAGASLLEHNLNQLARHGFRHVVVAAAAGQPEVGAAVLRDLAPRAARLGVRMELTQERAALGNIGAVQRLADRGSDVLTVFADNLTTVDLRSFFARHRSGGQAASILTHRHAYRIPYGEVRVEDGRLMEYVEKPVHEASVCSGVCAFAPRALAAIRPGERLGLSEFLTRLLQMGEVVRAYEHEAPWADVNDLAGLAQAEAMVRSAPGLFAAPAPELRP